MKIFAQNEPLTEAELDRLRQFLKNCKGGKAMNIEEMDGFFAALGAGSEIVMPSEYLSEVFGNETEEAHQFGLWEEAVYSPKATGPDGQLFFREEYRDIG